jgi:hypothetical protein
MTNQQVTILFNADGSVELEAHHFKGPGCAQATKFLEEALGKVDSRKSKPEWSMRAQAIQTQQVRR